MRVIVGPCIKNNVKFQPIQPSSPRLHPTSKSAIAYYIMPLTGPFPVGKCSGFSLDIGLIALTFVFIFDDLRRHAQVENVLRHLQIGCRDITRAINRRIMNVNVSLFFKGNKKSSSHECNGTVFLSLKRTHFSVQSCIVIRTIPCYVLLFEHFTGRGSLGFCDGGLHQINTD